MFIWTQKQNGRGRSGAFASITSRKDKSNRQKRVNFNFSAKFLEKFGFKTGDYIMVGYEKDMKRIGIALTKDRNKGYSISTNGASTSTAKVSASMELPFELDHLLFEEDEIFKENGIIIYELSNKDIADCI